MPAGIWGERRPTWGMWRTRSPFSTGFPYIFSFGMGMRILPQIRILWDENTTRYLHFETTFYITAYLLAALRTRVEKEERERQ